MQKNSQQNRKRKILYVITKSEPFGGAQRYVYDLATNLPKENYDAAVALGAQKNKTENAITLKEKLDSIGIRTLEIKSLVRDIDFLSECRVFFELLRLFKEEKPDIVHLNSSKAGGLGALSARIARIPKIVFTSHGLPFEEPRGPLTRHVLKILTWLTFLMCHKVILISRSNFNTASSFLFMSKRLCQIYNGIKPPVFLEKNLALNELTNHIKMDAQPENTAIIGTVAELTKNKGLKYLIHSCKILIEKNIQIVCLILGTGELEQELNKEIEELGLAENIFLLGYVDDAHKYLKGFDILVLPSLKEGHPYALLEAGYAELPVVSTSVSGTIDTITDMKSGMLVRSKNSEEIANAIAYLLEHKDKRDLFGKALHKTVTERFDLNTMIKNTILLYEK